MASIVGRKSLNYFFLFFLLLFFPTFPATVSIKVSTMDNAALKEAGVGQPFLLHVIVQNASNTAQYPIIKNIEKYSVRRSGFQMNMVNGTTSTTYSYQIRIDELGTFTLGPAQITEANGIVESEPISITVATEQKSNESSKRASDAKSKPSYLRLTCNKEKATVGERIQCALTFSTADPLVSLQSLIEPDQSSLTGFTLKNKSGPIPGNQTINGAEHRYAQWNWDIYPTKPGTLVIPAYAADYNTQSNNNMFAFLFTHNTLKRIYSNTVTLTVDPLPNTALKPVLIGSVSQFSARIEPAHARVGEGMVLTLSITGDGDLENMNMLPLIGLPEHLKWYESKQHDEPSKIDPTLTTHSMEYIVQALQPGDFQIPAQEIHYYDTQARSYKSRKTNAITIHITGTAPAQSQKNSTEQFSNDIETSLALENTDDIKPLAHDGPWAAQSIRMIPWQFFWLLISMLAIGWLLLTLLTTNQSWLYKQIARWNANGSVYSKARKQINNAHNAGNYAAFYTIFMNLLAKHFNIETAELSPELAEELLHSSGLSLQAIQDWKLFFTRIAESGFYKQSKDPYFYSNLYEQALYWVDVIEKLPRRNPS